MRRKTIEHCVFVCLPVSACVCLCLPVCNFQQRTDQVGQKNVHPNCFLSYGTAKYWVCEPNRCKWTCHTKQRIQSPDRQTLRNENCMSWLNSANWLKFWKCATSGVLWKKRNPERELWPFASKQMQQESIQMVQDLATKCTNALHWLWM